MFEATAEARRASGALGEPTVSDWGYYVPGGKQNESSPRTWGLRKHFVDFLDGFWKGYSP